MNLNNFLKGKIKPNEKKNFNIKLEKILLKYYALEWHFFKILKLFKF